jgi:hypothetical protein
MYFESFGEVTLMHFSVSVCVIMSLFEQVIERKERRVLFDPNLFHLNLLKRNHHLTLPPSLPIPPSFMAMTKANPHWLTCKMLFC